MNSNSSDDLPLTSLYLQKAREGDEGSLSWVVDRFSPVMLANARYRLPNKLREYYDPEDIVQDVWCIVLPKLSELDPDSSRYTPIFVKYLSQVLQYRINNLIRKHIRGKPAIERGQVNDGTELHNPVDVFPDSMAGAVTRLIHSEQRDMVLATLEDMSERDREILVLRGIEQHPYQEIASILNEDAAGLAVRYQRALAKIRKLLPGSAFDELSSK